MEAGFCVSLIVRRVLQEQFAFEPMQLWCVVTFSSGVHECQRFRERRQSCRWLCYDSTCLGEKRQKMRSLYLCSRGTKGSQALAELLDPFLSLSLVCQRPAVQDRTDCHPLRKSLFL